MVCLHYDQICIDKIDEHKYHDPKRTHRSENRYIGATLPLLSVSKKKRREETIYKCSINIKLKFIRRPEKFKLVGHKRAQCNACSVY